MPGVYAHDTSPNLGLTYLRARPQTQNLMDMWLDCRSDNSSWDQLCFKQASSHWSSLPPSS